MPVSAGLTGKKDNASSKPKVSRTVQATREYLGALSGDPGTVVGLVPTMGYFHEGHASLMSAAREECDVVVVSVFVNPIQFAPGEDLDAYPRDVGGDLAIATREGVDLLFAPSAAELYPAGFETRISVGSITEGLCGQSRPGHFDGVATVVAKFFNIVTPQLAYFGQKDAQQVAVIKRLVRDLDFNVGIRVGPIVREADGLALSSRNSYMDEDQRAQAIALYAALDEARRSIEAGEKKASRIRRAMRRKIGGNYLVELEYARVVDPETLQTVDEIDRPVLLAVAAKVGRARLIDNVIAAPDGG